MIKTSVIARDGSALLVGLDGPYRINLLGHWMYQDRGATLASYMAYLDAMAQIASNFIVDSPFAAKIDVGANFALLTVLREKWPVGSKSIFKVIAGRVNAFHN